MIHSNRKGLLAVIGNPISHSSSPRMHNYAYSSLGLPYYYEACLVEQESLGDAVERFKKEGFIGFNVTIPFKEAILPYLDGIDELASHIGAVNTVVREEAGFIGYNTDGLGFIYSLEYESGFNVFGKKVVILGAGGSAKAISFALLMKGIDSLVIVNRSKDRAEALTRHLSQSKGSCTLDCMTFDEASLNSVLTCSDLVINTSSVGMAPHQDQCILSDFSWCKRSHIVYDIVYKPKETVLLKKAKQAGARTMGGAGMLAGQGMFAFEYFTKQKAPFELFLSKVYE